MYRAVKDFLEDWQLESESTLKVFGNITDESLEQKVMPEGRSIGFIAWHIAMVNGEMLKRTGLDFGFFDENTPVPSNISEITNEYKRISGLVSTLVGSNWKDENLHDEVDMYGEMWKKGKVLMAVLAHQNHHRAQLTVLMRQAGLKVPGVYGPSKEEWAVYGMPPQP